MTAGPLNGAPSAAPWDFPAEELFRIKEAHEGRQSKEPWCDDNTLVHLLVQLILSLGLDVDIPQPAQPPRQYERVLGTVKWFNNEKGYGFIARDGGYDVFVHFSNISLPGYRTLVEGERVEFDVAPGRKGEEARDIVPLDKTIDRRAARAD